MSNLRRFWRILLLNEGIILIPFLIILGALYFDAADMKQQNFFNSWSFVIAIIIFIYFQICAITLTILYYLNISRKWILLISLLSTAILTLNQIGFHYVDLQYLLQRLMETGIYSAIILAFQIVFQFLSEYLCRRFKLIA